MSQDNSPNPNQREQFFESNQDEPRYYRKVSRWFLRSRRQMKLPLTYEGFQALLQYASIDGNVPTDDASASTLAGYVHHVSQEQDWTTFDRIVQVLRKSYSNNMTWNVDQQVKIRAKQAMVAAQAAKTAQAGPPASPAPTVQAPEAPKTPLTLVPPPQSTPIPPREASDASQDAPKGQ